MIIKPQRRTWMRFLIGLLLVFGLAATGLTDVRNTENPEPELCDVPPALLIEPEEEKAIANVSPLEEPRQAAEEKISEKQADDKKKPVPPNNKLDDLAWETLGIRYTPVPKECWKETAGEYIEHYPHGGVIIAEVREESGFAEKGVQPDDIIVGIKEWVTTSSNDIRYIAKHLQKQTIKEPDVSLKVKTFLIRDGILYYTEIPISNKKEVFVKGIVLDPKGIPLERAEITIPHYSAYTVHAVTDARGKFSFAMPTHHINNFLAFQASHTGRKLLGTVKYDPQKGLDDLVVKTAEGREIAGTVKDREGRPIEGALVGCGTTLLGSGFTRTDRDGAYRILIHQTQPLRTVFAFKKDAGFSYVDDWEARRKLPMPYRQSIKSSLPDGPHDFVLKGCQTVRVKVVNEKGDPIENAWVFPQQFRRNWADAREGALNMSGGPREWEGRTDANGIAVFDWIPRIEVCDIEFTASGGRCPLDGESQIAYGSAQETWVADNRLKEAPTLTMTLPRAALVKGSVTMRNGAPALREWISIRDSQGGHRLLNTDERGKFFLTFDARTSISLGVESKQGAAPGIFAFDVGDGTEEKRLDFVLDKGVRIYGSVFDTENKPIDISVNIDEISPVPIPEPVRKLHGLFPSGLEHITRQTGIFPGKNRGEYEYVLPPGQFEIYAWDHQKNLKSDPLAITIDGTEGEIRQDLYMKPYDPYHPKNNRPVDAKAGESTSPVADVRIVGNQQIQAKDIVKIIKTKKGNSFDETTLEEDKRALMQKGWFIDVKPKVEKIPEGFIVTFHLLERPILHYVKILGNKSLEKKELLEKAGIKAGDAPDPTAVHEARERIETFYREKGYNETRVAVLAGDQTGDRGAVFLVNETKPRLILGVEFEGNATVGSNRLETLVPFQPGWIDSEFGRKKLDEAVEKIAEYYHGLGFVFATVRQEFVEKDGASEKDKNRLTIKYTIKEGPRCRIKNIQVEISGKDVDRHSE